MPYTMQRPYLLTFKRGGSFLLTSEDAQQLIDSAEVIAATRDRVRLQASGIESVLTAATRGGGPAFELPRGRAKKA